MHDGRLARHSGQGKALAAHGDGLPSASDDATILTWALGTWVGLRTVQAYASGRVTRMDPRWLAVSGSKLVSGSRGNCSQQEARVGGLPEPDLHQRRPQPAGSGAVIALVAVDGEVLGGVGGIAVWGRRRRRGG